MDAILGVRPEGADAPPQSEEALALRFANRHDCDLRYVDAWHQWYRYDGRQWVRDDTRSVFSLAREICHKEACGTNEKARQLALASAKTRSAVVSLASDDRKLAATVAQWDADPWLLNSPSGMIDLRTGQCRPSRHDDYATRMTAVGPNGECPKWKTFLQQAADGDQELVDYLQRVVGYCLTGFTTEHALFFFHGPGANGKSVFITTLAGLMGDYHRTAAVETFTFSKTDRHPTDVAMLRGARLVTAVETEEGKGWDEARIKNLTGGDKVTARFMRQDFFEFLPQFKLLIAGNHRPGLRSVDEAMRRRLRLIPFDVIVPPDRRNPALTEELKAEWPGILKWAIEGCLTWQNGGLCTPPKVAEATNEYIESEDVIQKWIDECCTKSVESWVAVSALFGSWRSWATEAQEYIGSQRRFSQALIERGFKPHRRDQRGFLGLALQTY